MVEGVQSPPRHGQGPLPPLCGVPQFARAALEQINELGVNAAAPPRETDLQGIRTEAIGYREPDPPPDIYLASHSGSRPLDSLHKTFNRDGRRRNRFKVVRHVRIGLAVADPFRS